MKKEDDQMIILNIALALAILWVIYWITVPYFSTHTFSIRFEVKEK